MFGVLFDEQDRRASDVDFADDLENDPHELRREAQRWLIEHQQLRPRDEGSGDGQHLLFAAGKSASHLRESFTNTREEFQCTFPIGAETRLCLCARKEPSCRFSSTVILAKILRPSGTCTKPALHDLVRCPVLNRLAIEFESCRASAAAARKSCGACRFAGAVRADQRDDFTFLDAQRHAAEGLNCAVGYAQVFDFEKRHGVIYIVGRVESTSRTIHALWCVSWTRHILRTIQIVLTSLPK